MEEWLASSSPSHCLDNKRRLIKAETSPALPATRLGEPAATVCVCVCVCVCACVCRCGVTHGSALTGNGIKFLIVAGADAQEAAVVVLTQGLPAHSHGHLALVHV